MSNTAIEVITSVQRRRRWSAAEKERLVARALEPGASVSAVARAAVHAIATCDDGANKIPDRNSKNRSAVTM